MRKRRTAVKIILLGQAAVGKTSLLKRFVHEKYDECGYRATIGTDFATKRLETADRSVLLNVWDTAGTERFGALSKAFYRGATACVIVYDVHEGASNVEKWRESFLREVDDPDTPMLILGNKCDDPGSSPPAVPPLKPGDMHFFVSAKTGENVNQAFEALVNRVLERDRELDDRPDDICGEIRLGTIQPKPASSKCCA